MDVFITLDDAKAYGRRLARRGLCPTIYKRGPEYIVVERGEWPPRDSWPFLKWIGQSLSGVSKCVDWMPVLARLDTLEKAQEAQCVFRLLGYNPIIVLFPDITYDIFLCEAHVPDGANVIPEVVDGKKVPRIYSSSAKYEEEEEEGFEVPVHPI